MKTYDDMNREERVALYNDIEKRKQVAIERTNAYVDKMNSWQLGIAQALQGKQLDLFDDRNKDDWRN